VTTKYLANQQNIANCNRLYAVIETLKFKMFSRKYCILVKALKHAKKYGIKMHFINSFKKDDLGKLQSLCRLQHQQSEVKQDQKQTVLFNGSEWVNLNLIRKTSRHTL